MKSGYRPRLELLEVRETPAFSPLGFGAAGADVGSTLATDSAGNVYVAGTFQNTVDFDPGPAVVDLVSAGLEDLFLAKYTAAGVLIWARGMGGSNTELMSSIAVDGSGNVIAAGRFVGTADFDPGPGAFALTAAGTGGDAYVVKLDSGGNFLWAGAMGGTADDGASGITVDGSGTVFVTGYSGGGDFDPGPGTLFLPVGVFVCQLDSAGSLVWAKGFGAGGTREVTVDSSGNVYVTGRFTAVADFDTSAATYNLTSAGMNDAFVSKLDNGGNLIWAVQMGGTGDDFSAGMALDALGNIYLGGYFQASGDFDPGAASFILTSAGASDLFITKLDNAGNLTWAKSIGGTGNEVSNQGSLRLDAGGVIFTGSFSSTVDFDPGAATFNLVSAGSTDGVIGELDSSGNFVAAISMGGSGPDQVRDIALDASGQIYVTGSFSGIADFGGPGTANLTSAGGTDIFLAQLPGVIVNDTGGSTTAIEGGATDTYTIVLTWPPTADVVVTLTPDSQLSVSATTLTFTTANWNVLQTVTITAADDALIEGDHNGTIAQTVTSADLRYNGASMSLSAVVTDNDPNSLLPFQTYNQNGDYVAAGVGLFGLSAGTINLTGIPAGGSVTAAYLYWAMLDTVEVASLRRLSFDGTPLTGTIVGAGIWGGSTRECFAYRADVTGLVSGNGSYALSGVASGGSITGAGASLIVVYSHAAYSSRTILIYEGSDYCTPTTPTATNSFTGFTAPARINASTTFIAGEGQSIGETVSFAGSLTPLNLNNLVDGSDGTRWDTDRVNVAAAIAPGDTSASATMAYLGDFVFWVAQVISIGSAGILVSSTAGSTDVAEAGPTSDTYTVVLQAPPTANVVVSFSTASQATLANATLTFTPANWLTPQTVTVTAVDDFLTEGPHNGVIAATVTSTDTSYNGFALASITASITDNDTAGVNLTQSAGSTNITEGAATDTYTLVLNTAPSANVVITLGPDAQVSVPTVLTFTSANWNVAQTVTVTAVDDASFEGSHTGVITHTTTSADPNYNGQTVGSVTAQITDNDAVGVVQSGGSTDVSEAGLTDSYTLVLRSMPTSNVVITLTPDAQVATAPTTLTFTPATWNVPQTVTVSAVNDLVAEGLHSGVVTHVSSSGDANYNAIATPSVTANITDNDVAAMTLTPTSLSLNEGGPGGSFSVVLTSQPTANVVVAVAPDTQLSTTTPALTFTPVGWNVPQNVTLAAVNDVLAEGGLHNGVVTLTASGAPGYSGLVSSLTASITDDDIPGVTLSTTSLSVLEGNTRTYTAVLTLPPTSPVTINLTTGSLLSATPSVLIFTAANWNVPQAVVVTAVDDALVQGNHADTITHSAASGDPAYNGLPINALTVNIIDNEGIVINGTARPDTIVVTNSADLSSVFVKLNGKTTSYPASQMVINSFGGADNIQILDPRVPVVIVGGQLSDRVTITGQKTGNAFTLDDASLTVNGVSLQLFEVESVIAGGSTVDDTFTVTNEPTFNVLFRGEQGVDIVQASDRPNTWRINNPAAGTLNNIIAFTGTENLTGGASSDGFYFNAGRTMPGSIDGGGGVNTLDYSLYTTPVTVNLQASLATGVRGFQNIGAFVGGKSTADRIIGRDQANTWTVSEQNAGTVNSVAFRGMENLTGGQLGDAFRLNDGFGLKGRIDGGGGTDTLDYSSYLSRSVVINLQARLATNVAGFVNLESFVGGAGSDTLLGAMQINQWNITSTNSGDVNGLPFTGFENLTGSGKSDTFNVALSAFWTGLLDGGSGADFLNAVGTIVTGPTSGTLGGHPYRNIERRS